MLSECQGENLVIENCFLLPSCFGLHQCLVDCLSLESPQMLLLIKSLNVFTVRHYASTVYAVIVCPSVTIRSSAKMVKPRVTQTMPYHSPGTRVCRCQNSRQNSDRVTPTGVPNRGGVVSDRRYFTSISLCLRNVQDKDIVTMEG